MDLVIKIEDSKSYLAGTEQVEISMKELNYAVVVERDIDGVKTISLVALVSSLLDADLIFKHLSTTIDYVDSTIFSKESFLNVVRG